MITICRLFKSFTTKCVRREMQINRCNLTPHAPTTIDALILITQLRHDLTYLWRQVHKCYVYNIFLNQIKIVYILTPDTIIHVWRIPKQHRAVNRATNRTIADNYITDKDTRKCGKLKDVADNTAVQVAKYLATIVFFLFLIACFE